MTLAALDINSRHGVCGAVVFAGAATYAAALVDGGDAVYHADGSRRAVAGTAPAAYAVVFQHHGVSDTDSCLLFFGYGLDGSCRTHFAAAGAGRAAIALVEGHIGLHKAFKRGGGA